MNKKIFFLNARVNDRTHNRFSSLIVKLLKANNNVYILNIFNLKLFEKKIRYKNINSHKNLKIINIYNYEEFKSYLRFENSIFVLNSLTRGLKDFKIYYYLKKYRCFTVFIDNIGHLGGKISFDTELKNIFISVPHILEKGFYYVWRIFTIIGIFPKVNILFLSDKERKKILLNGLSHKIEKLFPNFKIFLYRKIILVNSDSYDLFLSLKKKLNKSKKKFMIYADSPINHFDRVSREGKIPKAVIEKFYRNLFICFKEIERTTNLKIIFTIHPNEKNNRFKINLLKKNKIKFYAGNTSKLIDGCEYFIFTHSSTVVNAIMFKKKIIALKSKFLGKHFNKISNKYILNLKLYSINIDKNNFYINKERIYTQTIKSIKFYEKFIKNSLIQTENKSSFNKIYETISKI